MIRWSTLSDIGQVRVKNEDSFLCTRLGDPGSDRWLAAVADGMGGHRAGGVASQIAVSVLEHAASSVPPSGSQPHQLLHWLRETVQRANEEIYRAGQRNPARQGMGTTLTAALVDDGRLVIAHVGDSRAYLIRRGSVERLTQDDSLVAEMVRLGDLSETEARDHPRRHVLTQALGTSSQVVTQVSFQPLEPGDAVCLCTDGLSDTVQEADILDSFKDQETFDHFAAQLVKLANQRGGSDNITVVALQWFPSEPGRQVSSS